jgi:DNA-binding PadR family transcriptional regulator
VVGAVSLRDDILAELASGIELQGLSLRERVTDRRSAGVSALVGVCRRISQSYGWYITLADMVDEGLIARREVPGGRYFYKITRKGRDHEGVG